MAEAYRLQLLRGLEDRLRTCGYPRIAGVDEVGRGCLAGPVVAAAVVLKPTTTIPGIEDSKAISAARREKIAARIRDSALACAVVPVSARTIDRSNILDSTRLAMMRAVEVLDPEPDCVLLDAVSIPGLRFPSLSVIRGDALSYSIAAASIVAKVERDRLMRELHDTYPQYGFADHKGYGSRDHLAALKQYGPSEIHRLTFRSVVPRVAEAERAWR